MTDTRRRTRGAGSVFRDKNGTWHYRRELDRDPATGRPRRIEAKGRTKAEARTRFDAKAAEMERDLTALLTSLDRGGGRSLVVPGEYLEVVVTKRGQG